MQFNIVTYVSAGFAPCLDITLSSWFEHSGANEIYIYTDNEAKLDVDKYNLCVIRHYEDRRDDGPISWMRKIEVISDALLQHNRLVWLDSDVLCAGSLVDAFSKMGESDIGATRMFNPTNRGYGAINAGVLFFNWPSVCLEFAKDWHFVANQLKPRGGWFEQSAASTLIHEAFHGQHNYYATPLSENIWNCEDDDDRRLVQRIQQYHPRLIHLKCLRWKKSELVNQIIGIVKGYQPMPEPREPKFYQPNNWMVPHKV